MQTKSEKIEPGDLFVECDGDLVLIDLVITVYETEMIRFGKKSVAPNDSEYGFVLFENE